MEATEPSRREFLIALAGAAALGLAACAGSETDRAKGSGRTGRSRAADRGPQPVRSAPHRLPRPHDAPFDTVVVLMMENRSFDHMLGWLPGATGKQAGLEYADKLGAMHATWPMAPNWQGCDFQDPFHLWQSMEIHYADGACDGFLRTQPDNDLFPIGYYTEGDLPILGGLAQEYSVLDHYFCSVMGPTWPNRLYQLCGTTDLDTTGAFPEPDEPRPVQLQTSIFDRVWDADLTGAYYTHGEPMTGLFASKKYDRVTYPIEKFWTDAKEGKLPNVVFVDPDYTSHAEHNGTSNDYHPYGSVEVAEGFVRDVHDALRDSPQWDRMVAVLNFDENGGFYDHVVPPVVADDSVAPRPGPWPNLGRTGFRVPAIAISPFAPRQVYTAGPYEHTSILKMIEWRWGLEPMSARDRNARNLADVLDFSRRRDPATLPAFTPTPAVVCTNPDHI
jgi:phospholipase C